MLTLENMNKHKVKYKVLFIYPVDRALFLKKNPLGFFHTCQGINIWIIYTQGFVMQGYLPPNSIVYYEHFPMSLNIFTTSNYSII